MKLVALRKRRSLKSNASENFRSVLLIVKEKLMHLELSAHSRRVNARPAAMKKKRPNFHASIQRILTSPAASNSSRKRS